MVSSMLAGYMSAMFVWWQIPLVIALVALIVFYVKWKKKQM